MVTESSLSSAALSAVPTGWWMYASPLLRLCWPCRKRGGHEGPRDELAVGVGVVALDGREQVVEQRPVLVGDLRQSCAVRQVCRKSGV